MRRSTLGLLSLSALLMLTGCSPEPSPQSQLPTPPPPQSSADVGGGSPAEILQPQGQEEYVAAIAECMNVAGFSATATGDSIVYEPTPTEQRSQFQAASDNCYEQAKDLAPPDVPVTEALLRLNYDRTVAAEKCLAQNGFPTPELGSYQDWVDDLYANVQYDVMRDVFAAERSGGPSMASVERLCPDPMRFFLDPVTAIYEDEVDYAAYRGAEG